MHSHYRSPSLALMHVLEHCIRLVARKQAVRRVSNDTSGSSRHTRALVTQLELVKQYRKSDVAHACNSLYANSLSILQHNIWKQISLGRRSFRIVSYPRRFMLVICVDSLAASFILFLPCTRRSFRSNDAIGACMISQLLKKLRILSVVLLPCVATGSQYVLRSYSS